MSLIDATYFKGKINIAGIEFGNSPVVGNTINTDFIPLFEKEYLIKALGYSLCTAFIAGIAAGSPEQQWLDLKNGVEYDANGKTYKWNGFVNSEKVSPIAYYVYIQHMQSNATNTTGTGETKNTPQNATNASPAMKIWDASIRLNELNESLWHYLRNVSYADYDSSQIKCFGSYNSFGL